jgi:hypothetical protein
MAQPIWRRALTRTFGPRRRQTHLRVEALETRALPSTITVTDLADDGPGSLRAAVTQAAVGDTIDFAPGLSGTILLTSGELAINQSLSIAGPGSDQIAVSGGATTRVFEVGAGAAVAIGGLTITGGHVAAPGFSTGVGAGVANYGSLTLTDCDIVDNAILGSSNSLALGAGIYNAGDLTLVDSTVARDRASGGSSMGGGIWNGTGVLTLIRSTLTADSANGIGGGQGGGVYSAGGRLSVSRCTITGNSTQRPVGGGGGIYIAAGTAAVADSLLADNAAAQGAGLDNAGDLTVTGTTLAGNHSSFPGGAGGGVYNTGRAKITNCTIAGNAQSGDGSTGGAVFNSSAGMVVLTSCTVTGNSAGDRYDGVGGIEADGTVQLLNTIVAANSSPAGRPDLFGTFHSLGYNLIGVGDGVADWTATDRVGSGADPLDPQLGALGDHGGAVPTIPVLAGSPALDAGDPSWLGAPDQRGVTRGGGVNIGAFQATATQLILAAPAEVAAGMPFDVVVTASDPYGNVAVGYTGLVSLYATDAQAPYQGAYAFTPADAGTHVFTGVTLLTPGPRTLLAADGPLVGLADVMVDPGAHVRTRRHGPAGRDDGPPLTETFNENGAVFRDTAPFIERVPSINSAVFPEQPGPATRHR